MINIDRAVLHILDLAGGTTVYSREELELTENVADFLAKHIMKASQSPDMRPGEFYEDSRCRQQVAAYLAGEIDFVAFSESLAHLLEEAMAQADELLAADLIVCDMNEDGRRRIAILRSNSRAGFIHQAMPVDGVDGGMKSAIVSSTATLPAASQRMDEFAFIDADTLAVDSLAKKYPVGGSAIAMLTEMVLECRQTPSQKDALRNIDKTVKQVAASFGEDEVAAQAAAKHYIAESLAETDELDARAIGREVFKEKPALAAEYDEQIQAAGFTAPVAVNQETALKKVGTHKLKTSTGIELTIPTDYFNSTEFVEFNQMDDGTMSITLKRIVNITD